MPTTVARMSPESEQRLLETLDKVADFTNAGDDPNEAIAKAASESRIPAGHVNLLVAAYNTGRTTAQRQLGKDVWEKSAEFQLADTVNVLERMFPDKPKTAGQKARDAIRSSDYDVSPGRMVREFEAARRNALAVSEGLDFPDVKSASGIDLKAPYLKVQEPVIKQRRVEFQLLEKAANDARVRWQSAESLLTKLTDALIDSFKQQKAAAFDDVRDNCVRLHGRSAKALFGYLEDRYPELRGLKTARVKGAANGPSYDLVAQCLELLPLVDTLEKDAQDKRASATQAYDAYLIFLGKKAPEPARNMMFGFELSPPAKQASAPKVDPVFAWERNKEANATPGFFTGMLSSVADPINTFKSEMLKRQAQTVADASVKKPQPDMGLDDELKRIRQKNIVQDLLSSDDVVSGYDPHQVLGAYKEIADIAPIAAQRSAIAKDFTRRRLAGGQLSYFDLEALTRLEKNLAELQGKLPKRPGGPDA